MKTLLSNFGKTYQVSLIEREEIEKIIDNLSFREIVIGTYQNCPPISGGFCKAMLSCETGKVSYFGATGNTRIIEDSHFSALYSLKYQDCIEIDEKDEDRIIEALLWSADYDFDHKSISEQLDEIYG